MRTTPHNERDIAEFLDEDTNFVRFCEMGSTIARNLLKLEASPYIISSNNFGTDNERKMKYMGDTQKGWNPNERTPTFLFCQG